MSSLADLPKVIGFFSYSREDDEDFGAQLSSVREAIQKELRAQLGRTKRDLRLWQDQDAIAPGELWEAKIASAINEATFFIPIVTPRAINSKHCKFEFDAFLAREQALGRNNLVFPILYIAVPALADEASWRSHPVLSVIGARQFVDWRDFRQWPSDTPAFRKAIIDFCASIAAALSQTWLPPEERLRQDLDQRLRKEAEARNRARDEQRRREEQKEAGRKAAEERQSQEEKAAQSQRTVNGGSRSSTGFARQDVGQSKPGFISRLDRRAVWSILIGFAAGALVTISGVDKSVTDPSGLIGAVTVVVGVSAYFILRLFPSPKP